MKRPADTNKMTDRQIAIIKAGFTAGKGQWARPQQMAALANILTIDGGLPPDTVGHQAIIAAFGPFSNASQTLGELKKLGVISNELSAAQKAAAAALATSLAS